MIIEQLVGDRHIRFVPFGIAGLVSADEQNSRSAGIKGVQHTQLGSVPRRDDSSPQLFHVRVLRGHDHIGMRVRENEALLL